MKLRGQLVVYHQLKSGKRVNFGLVDLDFSRPVPELTLAIRDVKGDTRLQQRLSLDQLRFTKA